jgi:glyoxylase-like metal-dependent hydrolase (beta-lactamase superfamily II)
VKRVRLQEGAYLLRGGSNVGLVVANGRAVLIDSGLDRDAGRRALRHVEDLAAELVAVLVTHAHADHFGGAGYLRRRTGARVHAPAFEDAVVANPLLEPTYLFGGAEPPDLLRHKFLLAKPSPVDGRIEPGRFEVAGIEFEAVPLPGHAHNQMGVAHGDVLYCADGFFPPDVLDKHGVPFMVDLDAWLETLARLPTLSYTHFCPGHGDAHDPAALAGAAAYNADRLRQIRRLAWEATAAPATGGQVLRQVADGLGLAMDNPTQYHLNRTAVLAALASLQRAGEVEMRVRDNRLLWVRA